MSRKNLARTVIEGGRSYYNHNERDHSHAIERASTRAWLDRVRVDPDEADDTCPPPRPHVGKDFHDKLGPAMRWLASQVGRPWDKVYSDLCSTFDRRNLAGMHVIDAHMIGEVRRHELVGSELAYRQRDFYVDAHGILRRSAVASHQLRRRVRELRTWADGCRAALTFRGWWWIRLATVGLRTTYAWARPLTKGDLRRLDRLPAVLRDVVVVPVRR